ncbi:hypothetical protein ACFL1R_09220 [Candidatus Latescibacterota bacterium]
MCGYEIWTRWNSNDSKSRSMSGQCWSLWDAGHHYSYDLFPDRNGEPEDSSPCRQPMIGITVFSYLDKWW